MAYKIQRSPAIERDLDLVFDHLHQSYLAFGDDALTAFARAAQRVDGIRKDMSALARAPHRGTLDGKTGMRHVTKGQAIFYFTIDEATETVHLLAVFFGGQDHQRHMLARLGGDTGSNT